MVTSDVSLVNSIFSPTSLGNLRKIRERIFSSSVSTVLMTSTS